MWFLSGRLRSPAALPRCVRALRQGAASGRCVRALSVQLETVGTPVVLHSERLLRQALEEVGGEALSKPLCLVDRSFRPGHGVSVRLATPADADAAGVLAMLLGDDDDADGEPAPNWKVRELRGRELTDGRSFGGWTEFSVLLTEGEQRLRLALRHTLEMSSSSEQIMHARPRLDEGELLFEAPSLSPSMARRLAAAAQHVDLFSTGRAKACATGGGPIAALDRLLEPLERDLFDASAASSEPAAAAAEPAAEPTPAAAAARAAPVAAPSAPPASPKPFITDAGAAASEALAQVWTKGRGGSGPDTAAAATSASDPARAPRSPHEAATMLVHLGARILCPPGAWVGHEWGIAEGGGGGQCSWDSLAGGAEVQRQIEEALVLPLAHPEAFAAVTRGTRVPAAEDAAGGAGAAHEQAPPRPTALLLHGPPGTGKTTAARIAAAEAGLPLVFAPLETLISKWYGQSEQQLAALFTRCEALGRNVLFLDEIDALAGSRDREMHEASRRSLSVLLRRMDGLEAGANTAIIAATNRPQDLDAALLSRFDVRVAFPPPDAAARALIFGRYARQLEPAALAALGEASEGLSGRDILDVCKSAERRWAAALVRGEETSPLPPHRLYDDGVARRRSEAIGAIAGEAEGAGS